MPHKISKKWQTIHRKVVYRSFMSVKNKYVEYEKISELINMKKSTRKVLFTLADKINVDKDIETIYKFSV